MFTNQLLGLTQTISPTDNTDPMDVVKTKSALAQTGHYDVPEVGITPILDQPMIDGLKTFQKDNDLKVDGIMKPNGPTENALGQQVKPILSGKPKTPKPPKIDPKSGLEEIKPIKVTKPKTAIIPEGNTVDDRIKSIMKDDRYWQKREKPIVDHVVRQFERAYPGEVQYDETGKTLEASSVISPEGVEPYDPNGELQDTLNNFSSNPSIADTKVKESKLNELLSFKSGIGGFEENRRDDLVKLNKMLEMLDGTKSVGNVKDREDNDLSIKRFQLANGLKVDGIMKRDGETAEAMQGNIKKLTKQYLQANGSSKRDDQTEDEWIEEEIGREDPFSLWEAILNFFSSLYRDKPIPDGPFPGAPRGNK